MALVNGIPLENIDWAKFASSDVVLGRLRRGRAGVVVSRKGARNVVEVSQLAGREMGRAEILLARPRPGSADPGRDDEAGPPPRVPRQRPADPRRVSGDRTTGRERDPGEMLTEPGGWAEREAAEIRDMLPTTWGGRGFSRRSGASRPQPRAGASSQLAAVVGPEPTMTTVVSQELVGAVGEAIRNAEVHARARRLTVYAECLDATFQIVVSDDGCGFDEARVRGGNLPP